MPEELKLNLNWSGVEKALSEGTFSGYKMGILETEKLLKILFDQKRIPGKNMEAKIKYVSRFLSQPQKLTYSQQIMQRILEEPHFEISREETKQVIGGYWQAMLDIEEAVATLSLWQKLALRFKYYFGLLVSRIRKIGLFILVLAFFIWLFGETSPGQKFIKGVVKINHFFIFKILFWGGIIIVGALIVTGAFLFLFRKRSRL